MPTLLRRTNKFGLNHAVRIHGYTQKGFVTKRPIDPRTFYIKSMWFERGQVFYSLRCEEDGHEFPSYTEQCLSKAA